MGQVELLTMDDLLGEISPQRQFAWERLALARAVANALVTYRGIHKLSQRALAARLGVRPSIVGRLELAEHNPSIETLQQLSRSLGIRIVLEVVLPGQEPAYLVDQATSEGKAASADGARVLVATTA